MKRIYHKTNTLARIVLHTARKYVRHRIKFLPSATYGKIQSGKVSWNSKHAAISVSGPHVESVARKKKLLFHKKCNQEFITIHYFMT